jgi:ParB/RepB/Spo0J family partition protein
MTTFTQAPLALIVPSTTNPRKTFDPAKLAELTASIAAMGVHQPVLLRPLPAARLEDTARMKPRPEYELVCGERRYRASIAAKVDTIPAMVRELTDDQVMEIQIVENLQRDDLTELEEAEGYEALMKHSSLNADQVGEKIGKSRSYVYGRLKLLDLCQEARTSLRDRTIDASRALVVARIPDHKLQIKAMKEIVGGEKSWPTGLTEPMSYRKALEHVQQNYMLNLSSAKFKITDESLLAGAGSCKTCTKRTGHDPDLFSDVKGADVCTDPPCFHRKEEAHTAQLVEAAKAKGQTVITGKEAAELRGAGYQDKFTGYRRLDDAADSPTDQPLRKIIGGLMKQEGIKPVAIEHPSKKGVLVECLPNEVALRLLKMAEKLSQTEPKASKEVQELVSAKKAKAEEKALAQFEQGWRDTLVVDTWRELQDHSGTFSNDVHRYLVTRAAKSLSTDNAEAICKILNLGKVSPHSALVDHAKETDTPALLHMLIIMQEASSAYEHGYNGQANEGLMLIAGEVFHDQLKRVIEDIKLETKAKVWPKASEKLQKAPTPHAPAAQAEGGGGEAKKSKAALRAPKPKLRAEAAMQGIAAALQDEEARGDFTPGSYLGADAPGNDVGPASRPDEPLHTAVDDQADMATAKGAKPAGQSGQIKRSDALLKDAVELVKAEQAVSVRLIKTKLSVGTARAMKIIDELERDGVVSGTDERGARKVLVAV